MSLNSFFAHGLYILAHFLVVLYKATTSNDQIIGFVESLNTQQLIFQDLPFPHSHNFCKNISVCIGRHLTQVDFGDLGIKTPYNLAVLALSYYLMTLIEMAVFYNN